MTGVYIHVPFCLRKCPYCDFYSGVYSSRTAGEYVEAVVRNIQALSDKKIECDTIYFGGGTPSLLSAAQLEAIISACANAFTLVSPEITVECNPSSVDDEKLCGYRSAGADRLSFGVQSSDNKNLSWLGRLHDFPQAQKAVESGVKAGFENISCDIMLGLAGQTHDSLEADIKRFVQLPIQHISAYMLKIEQGTAFDCDEIRSACADEDTLCELYLQTVSQLAEHGFEQYEISNFAKKGFESRHNLKYWHDEEYIGIGPAAHSYFGCERYCCPPDTADFIASPVQKKVITDPSPDRLDEYIMLGLRLTEGISLDEVVRRGGDHLISNIKRCSALWQKHGLCSLDGEKLTLTPQGFLLSNELIAELISG